MNVGRYMKDARAQQLPLVGGDHDWTEIFSRWGVLTSDVRIGNTVRLLGLCIVLYGLLLRPCEVLSGVPNPTILEVAHNALRSFLQHRHMLVGGLA